MSALVAILLIAVLVGLCIDDVSNDWQDRDDLDGWR